MFINKMNIGYRNSVNRSEYLNLCSAMLVTFIFIKKSKIICIIDLEKRGGSPVSVLGAVSVLF